MLDKKGYQYASETVGCELNPALVVVALASFGLARLKLQLYSRCCFLPKEFA